MQRYCCFIEGCVPSLPDALVFVRLASRPAASAAGVD
jgi:hypothetical protein